MLLFIYLRLSKPESIRRFNTSHVTLYRQRCSWLHYRSDVSIHHMLLFILNSAILLLMYTSFNTSHVTLYQNGLMVLHISKRFQYITCYSLSHVDALNDLLQGRFNTSHVTLYLKPLSKSLADNPVSIHHMLLFIPIEGRSCTVIL